MSPLTITLYKAAATGFPLAPKPPKPKANRGPGLPDASGLANRSPLAEPSFDDAPALSPVSSAAPFAKDTSNDPFTPQTPNIRPLEVQDQAWVDNNMGKLIDPATAYKGTAPGAGGDYTSGAPKALPDPTMGMDAGFASPSDRYPAATPQSQFFADNKTSFDPNSRVDRAKMLKIDPSWQRAQAPAAAQAPPPSPVPQKSLIPGLDPAWNTEAQAASQSVPTAPGAGSSFAMPAEAEPAYSSIGKPAMPAEGAPPAKTPEQLFADTHKSSFDPNSRVDRAKMLKIDPSWQRA